MGSLFSLSQLVPAVYKLLIMLSGPLGGFALSFLFNVFFCFLVVWLMKIIAKKDKQINDLISDLKLLAVKSELTKAEFSKLLQEQFFKTTNLSLPSDPTPHPDSEPPNKS